MDVIGPCVKIKDSFIRLILIAGGVRYPKELGARRRRMNFREVSYGWFFDF